MKKHFTFYISLFFVLIGLFGIWLGYSGLSVAASVIVFFSATYYCVAYAYKFFIDK